MPGLQQVPVSLHEVVEVKGGGLSDDEVYSLLLLVGRRLKELIDNGAAPDTPAGFGADNVYLYADGSVAINITPCETLLAPFLAPECLLPDANRVFDPSAVFVYCLGASMLYALEYAPDKPSRTSSLDQDNPPPDKDPQTVPPSPSTHNRLALLSPELLSWLNLMTVKDQKTRPTLNKLLQVASHQITKKELNAASIVSEMNVSILGMGDDLYSDSETSVAIPDSVLPTTTDSEADVTPKKEGKVNGAEDIAQNTSATNNNNDIHVNNGLHRAVEQQSQKAVGAPQANSTMHDISNNNPFIDNDDRDVMTPITPVPDYSITDNNLDRASNKSTSSDTSPRLEASSPTSTNESVKGRPSAKYETMKDEDTNPLDQSATSNNALDQSGASSNIVVLNPFDSFDDDFAIGSARFTKSPPKSPATVTQNGNEMGEISFGQAFHSIDDTAHNQHQSSPHKGILPVVDFGSVKEHRNSTHSLEDKPANKNDDKSADRTAPVPLQSRKSSDSSHKQAVHNNDGHGHDLLPSMVFTPPTQPSSSNEHLAQKPENFVTIIDTAADETTAAEETTAAGAERKSPKLNKQTTVGEYETKDPFESFAEFDTSEQKDKSIEVGVVPKQTKERAIEPIVETSLEYENPLFEELHQIQKPTPKPRHHSPVKKTPAPEVPLIEQEVIETKPRQPMIEENGHETDSPVKTTKVGETSPKASPRLYVRNRERPPSSVVNTNNQPNNRQSNMQPPTITVQEEDSAVSHRQSAPAMVSLAGHNHNNQYEQPGPSTINAISSKPPLPQSATLPRANSIRRSKRSSSQTKPMGGPEFLFISRKPSLRLTAASSNKRRKLLARVDQSSVHVVLLNGQRVDVKCWTDVTASEILDVIVNHTSIREAALFALTVIKDGEHFFLEPDEKLHKQAPPGWKHPIKHLTARNVFTLYIRLKYYPPAVEYIKHPMTEHMVYLQLRRDIIDERLHTDRLVADAAFQLAAIAMQAECSDRPTDYNMLTYFQPDQYLPHRHLLVDLATDDRIRQVLAELHTQYSGMSAREAEAEYMKMCMAQREYGIHFHRLYRSKPSTNLGNTPLGDPDTGTPLWIGLMPRGLIIFEEKRGERSPISQHPWHTTQTLQFDRKRFVIVPQTRSSPDAPTTVLHLPDSQVQAGKTSTPKNALVFYTDDHKKSSYFVKFASSQHKYGLKLRKQTTLGGEKNSSATLPSRISVDSGAPMSDISREASPDEKIDEMQKQATLNRRKQIEQNLLNGGQMYASGTAVNHNNNLISHQPEMVNVSMPHSDMDKSAAIDESTVTGLNDLSGASLSPWSHQPPPEFVQFTVNLVKDPAHGLGLTLVDGRIQNIQGIYIKSLTPGGPADLQGRVKMGDKLICINGVKLDDKNRHDAVQLVKAAGVNVEVQVVRLKGLISSSEESLASNSHKQTNTNVGISRDDSGLPGNSRPTPRQRARTDIDSLHVDALPAFNSVEILQDPSVSEQPNGAESGRTRPIKNTNNKPHARAVSDMTHLKNHGAAGKILNKSINQQQSHANQSMESISSHSSGEFAIPQSNNVSNVSGLSQNITKGSGMSHRPVSTDSSKMYKGLYDSSDDDESQIDTHTKPVPLRQKVLTSSEDDEDSVKFTTAFSVDTPTTQHDTSVPRATRYRTDSRRSDVDWADALESLDVQEDDEHEWNTNAESVTVVLEKTSSGSLGLKIAGAGHNKRHVYIKALVSAPALACHNMRPGDRLTTVNGRSTIGLSHQEIVSMLKNADSPVTLGLLRLHGGKTATQLLLQQQPQPEVETIDVRLEKPVTGSFGLSLATLAGGSGVYVRSVSQGSVAQLDGRLKVGDRLSMINNQSVLDRSPKDVVEMLKLAVGYVDLQVVRERSRTATLPRLGAR